MNDHLRSSPQETKADGQAGAVLLGVGVLALLVAALFKLGSWYDGWQSLAAIDPELAERRMLRSIRSGLALLSLAIGLAGAGVGLQGWRAMAVGRFPPNPGRKASLTGEEARKFGRLLLSLAVFGSVGVIAATWLVGIGIGKRAVANKMAEAKQQPLQPYEVKVTPPPNRRPAQRAEDERESLREAVLLNCMPTDRTLCTGAIKARLQSHLAARLRDGSDCATIASDLTVPEEGIQPWCSDAARQLSGGGDKR